MTAMMPFEEEVDREDTRQMASCRFGGPVE